MSRLSRKAAFAQYGAKLRNPNWSCSAWTPDGSLVVSMWSHHYRKGPGESAEYVDSLDRWKGAGNTELRQNIALALERRSPIRLVISCAKNELLVQAGGEVKVGELYVRSELIGKIVEFDGTNLVLRFVRLF